MTDEHRLIRPRALGDLEFGQLRGGLVAIADAVGHDEAVRVRTALMAALSSMGLEVEVGHHERWRDAVERLEARDDPREGGHRLLRLEVADVLADDGLVFPREAERVLLLRSDAEAKTAMLAVLQPEEVIERATGGLAFGPDADKVAFLVDGYVGGPGMVTTG